MKKNRWLNLLGYIFAATIFFQIELLHIVCEGWDWTDLFFKETVINKITLGVLSRFPPENENILVLASLNARSSLFEPDTCGISSIFLAKFSLVRSFPCSWLKSNATLAVSPNAIAATCVSPSRMSNSFTRSFINVLILLKVEGVSDVDASTTKPKSTAILHEASAKNRKIHYQRLLFISGVLIG